MSPADKIFFWESNNLTTPLAARFPDLWILTYVMAIPEQKGLVRRTDLSGGSFATDILKWHISKQQKPTFYLSFHRKEEYLWQQSV